MFNEDGEPLENLPSPHPARMDMVKYRFKNALSDKMVKIVEKHVTECKVCSVAYHVIADFDHDSLKDLAKDEPIFVDVLIAYEKYAARKEKKLPVSKKILDRF